MGNKIKKNSSNQINRQTLYAQCDVNETLAIIGKRWLMAALYEIAQGNDQFSSLRKRIEGLSEHVLGTRIQDLVEQGLIQKEEMAESKLRRVRYRITAKGEELLCWMDDLHAWTKKWQS